MYARPSENAGENMEVYRREASGEERGQVSSALFLRFKEQLLLRFSKARAVHVDANMPSVSVKGG